MCCYIVVVTITLKFFLIYKIVFHGSTYKKGFSEQFIVVSIYEEKITLMGKIYRKMFPNYQKSKNIRQKINDILIKKNARKLCKDLARGTIKRTKVRKH